MSQNASTEPLRIGCVPEHFSVPFELGQAHKCFTQSGSNVEIVFHPRGTGSMCSALRENKLDVAIALTEGLVLGMFNLLITVYLFCYCIC